MLQEIDEAIVENSYNYVVEDLCIETSDELTSGIAVDPLYKYYHNENFYTLYVRSDKPAGITPTYSYSLATTNNTP